MEENLIEIILPEEVLVKGVNISDTLSICVEAESNYKDITTTSKTEIKQKGNKLYLIDTKNRYSNYKVYGHLIYLNLEISKENNDSYIVFNSILKRLEIKLRKI